MTTRNELPPMPEDALKIARMTQELRDAARELTRQDGRYLLDAYYQIQRWRIRAHNQAQADEMQDDAALPVLDFMSTFTAALEKRVQLILKHFANAYTVGEWSMSITGVGKTLAAGLLTHIDITRADTAGAIWRFAGLDPSMKWWKKEEARELANELVENSVATDEELVRIARRLDIQPESFRKRLELVADQEDPNPTRSRVIEAITMRPWNADLKTLCWKIGESFQKQQADNSFYRREYDKRKAYEQEKNEAGDYADQAARKLEQRPNHAQADTYAEGRLPDGHINMRVKRWTVKLFLAHWHWVAYLAHYGKEPPNPYIIEHGAHTHVVEPPNWPME